MPDTTKASSPSGNRPQASAWDARLLGLGLAGAWGFGATVVAGLTSVGSVIIGWFPAGLVFFAGFYPAARLFGLRRRAGVIVAAALALVGGVLAYQSAPPGQSQLRVAAWRLGMPEGWERLSTESYGNGWCFDECPTLRRVYRAPVPSDEAIDVLSDHFTDGGLRGRGPGRGETWGEWTRGRVRISVSFGATEAPSALGSDPGASTVVVFYTGR